MENQKKYEKSLIRSLIKANQGHNSIAMLSNGDKVKLKTKKNNATYFDNLGDNHY